MTINFLCFVKDQKKKKKNKEKEKREVETVKK